MARPDFWHTQLIDLLKCKKNPDFLWIILSAKAIVAQSVSESILPSKTGGREYIMDLK